jgi:hypothetical protein
VELPGGQNESILTLEQAGMMAANQTAAALGMQGRSFFVSNAMARVTVHSATAFATTRVAVRVNHRNSMNSLNSLNFPSAPSSPPPLPPPSGGLAPPPPQGEGSGPSGVTEGNQAANANENANLRRKLLASAAGEIGLEVLKSIHISAY